MNCRNDDCVQMACVVTGVYLWFDTSTRETTCARSRTMFAMQSTLLTLAAMFPNF